MIAVLAFGLLQTVVRAWYAGSDAASATRLIARNAISLTFSMPVYYREKIRAVPGVTGVSVSNWFGGIYKEPKNFFAQFAVDAPTYFPMYPEFIFDPDEYAAFLRDRRGAVVGRQLADLYGFKVGDTIPLKSTIYPGNWEFTVRAIYDARDETTITRQMYFHFDYLNEQIKKVFPRRADQAGVFIVSIADSSASADIARAIDAEFKNSLAETLTETEKAFTLAFVAMIETIVVAIEGVSYVVILIIMAVAANTMAMTARERLSEYATLKALGFAAAHRRAADPRRGDAARRRRRRDRDAADAAGRAGRSTPRPSACSPRCRWCRRRSTCRPRARWWSASWRASSRRSAPRASGSSTGCAMSCERA